MSRPPPAGLRLGLDLGSTAAKAVLIDAGGAILATRLDASGRPPDEVVADLLRGLPDGAGTAAVAATGYGRSLVGCAERKITEITCHARGVGKLHPDARSILDIGGQDAKAIRLGRDGGVEDFAMNDRCAAGTGRFLEMAARRYGLEVAGLSEFCGHSPVQGSKGAPWEISSTCVVFAESELIGLNARGTPPIEALRAVHRSIARRVSLLLKQVGAAEPLYFTGGVAQNAALAAAIGAECGMAIRVAERPQFTGALGAALSA
ncbi:MAG: acyl-CoA dehydratase activase [Planctomycetota bacterium]|jgi:predicted CoA-substrate-specific enzyme activase|nr:acyl-CoA dehydratase activase [Planctomycetota bacterium]